MSKSDKDIANILRTNAPDIQMAKDVILGSSQLLYMSLDAPSDHAGKLGGFEEGALARACHVAALLIDARLTQILGEEEAA